MKRFKEKSIYLQLALKVQPCSAEESEINYNYWSKSRVSALRCVLQPRHHSLIHLNKHHTIVVQQFT